MEAQASGLGLKRRIGLLVVSVIVATTMLAAPAQAANQGKQCVRNHPGNETAQENCCKKQSDSKKERKKCLRYVQNN
jgi:hypothetical protein